MKQVPGEGNLHADIMLVGEAPGRLEALKGHPFVGHAGKCLDGMLREVGILRSDCYVTNVCKVRPPGNNFKWFLGEGNDFLVAGLAELLREIQSVKPNVIVPLGNEALFALTNLRGIMKWRGSILSTTYGKVIPTIHPAAILREWKFRVLSVLDLKRVRLESESPSVQLPIREFITDPTVEDIDVYLQRATEHGEAAFDIETVGGRFMTRIGFSYDPAHAISIPIKPKDSGFREKVELIRAFLEDSNVGKIAQNAQYDCIFLPVFCGISVVNLTFDTMIAQHCCYPELPKDLGTLGSMYTRQPFWKDMSASDPGNYNALDSCCTYEIAQVLRQEMRELGVEDIYYQISHPLLSVLMDMQLRGVNVDREKRAIAAVEVIQASKKLEGILNEAVGYDVNIASPKQMADFLYKELGLPVQKMRGTGRTTTNEEALKTLARKHPSLLFDLIGKVRELKKLYSTYLGTPLSDDGRLRCEYYIGGTETGRLSSRRSSALNTGTNLQNVPRDSVCRAVIIPDEGLMFTEGDLEQAETHVVARLSGDPNLLRAVTSGRHVHTEVAKMMFSTSTPTKDQVRIAKTCGHALNYGLGPMQLAKLLVCSLGDAKRMRNRYFQTFPMLNVWHGKVVEELRKTRCLSTPFNRKRMFFDRWGDSLFRAAYAFVPQSTVGDYLNKGLLAVASVLPEPARAVLQVHDSIIVQHKPEQLNEVCTIMRRALNIPLTINNKTFTIPVAFKSGPNWNELNETKVQTSMA